MAIISQIGAPTNFLGGLIEITTPSYAAAVTLQDIDLLGMNSGYSRGIYGQGNNTTGMLTLTRSWVENFDILGIYLSGISLTATDSDIDNNGSNTEEYAEAGGIFMGPPGKASVTLLLNHSSVTNNQAGGVDLELAGGSVSNIKNSTICDNWGGNGLTVGGSNGPKLNIYGSSIFLNNADYEYAGTGYKYGGVQIVGGSGAVVTIDQTVVADNAGPGGDVADLWGIVTTMNNSLLGNDWDATIEKETGVNLVDLDAQIDPVLRGDLGGHGQRHPLTHAPVQGSPLIDATPTPDSNVGTQDEGYRNRCYDFYPGGYKCDIGAVELQKND